MRWLPSPADDTPEGKIAAAELRLTLRNGLALLPEPALALVAWFLLRDQADPEFLRRWTSLLLGLGVVRAAAWTVFRPRADDLRMLELWGWVVFLLAGLGGLFWGALGAAIGLVDAPMAKLVIGLLVMGLAAGNAVAMSAHPLATIAFLIPSITPMAVALMRHEGNEGRPLGVLLLLFMFLIASLTRTFRQWLAERVRLELASAELMTQLAKSKTQAEETARSKSRFLADMSHEFRTPLNAILGFSDVLRDPARQIDPAKRTEYAADIHHAAENLLAFVDDVLDLSRAEAGSFELSARRIHPRALVQAGLRLVAGMALTAQVLLVNDVPEEAPELWGDDRAARHCLVNLLSNAVKYTPAGGRVVVTYRQRDDGGVDLTVRDNGIGVAPEDMDRLFVPFERIRPKEHGPKGTGLGLALTKTLMEAQGGTISVVSEPGRGSSFTLHFPASSALIPGPG